MMNLRLKCRTRAAPCLWYGGLYNCPSLYRNRRWEWAIWAWASKLKTVPQILTSWQRELDSYSECIMMIIEWVAAASSHKFPVYSWQCKTVWVWLQCQQLQTGCEVCGLWLPCYLSHIPNCVYKIMTYDTSVCVSSNSLYCSVECGIAPYTPVASTSHLFPGTWYLVGIDDKHRRRYDRVPLSQEESCVNGVWWTVCMWLFTCDPSCIIFLFYQCCITSTSAVHVNKESK